MARKKSKIERKFKPISLYEETHRKIQKIKLLRNFKTYSEVIDEAIKLLSKNKKIRGKK